MPFGKHKGTKMANVPADYLLWLYGQECDRIIKDYIKDNLDVLSIEIGKVKAQYPKYRRSR